MCAFKKHHKHANNWSTVLASNKNGLKTTPENLLIQYLLKDIVVGPVSEKFVIGTVLLDPEIYSRHHLYPN